MARINRFTRLTAALFAVATLSTTSTFAVENTSWGQFKQSTTERNTPMVAAKRPPGTGNGDAIYVSTDDSRTFSAVIDAAGGTLRVRDLGPTSSPKDNLRITFTVPENALDAPVEITMTLVGNTLSDLVVGFAPAGLEFLIDAELEIMVGDDLVDTPLDQVQVEHTHADGTVEGDVLINVNNTGSTDTFNARVPGFSRYSMGGGY